MLKSSIRTGVGPRWGGGGGGRGGGVCSLSQCCCRSPQLLPELHFLWPGLTSDVPLSSSPSPYPLPHVFLLLSSYSIPPPHPSSQPSPHCFSIISAKRNEHVSCLESDCALQMDIDIDNPEVCVMVLRGRRHEDNPGACVLVLISRCHRK